MKLLRNHVNKYNVAFYFEFYMDVFVWAFIVDDTARIVCRQLTEFISLF